MTEVLAVIPARYASTRLPGKPLADIAGKPMIQHVWERVSAVLPAVVATEAVGHQVRVTYLPVDRKARRIIRAA